MSESRQKVLYLVESWDRIESGGKTGKLTIIDGGNYSTSEMNAAQYMEDLGNILARVRGAIEKNGGTCNINDIVVMPK